MKTPDLMKKITELETALDQIIRVGNGLVVHGAMPLMLMTRIAEEARASDRKGRAS